MAHLKRHAPKSSAVFFFLFCFTDRYLHHECNSMASTVHHCPHLRAANQFKTDPGSRKRPNAVGEFGMPCPLLLARWGHPATTEVQPVVGQNLGFTAT